MARSLKKGPFVEERLMSRIEAMNAGKRSGCLLQTSARPSLAMRAISGLASGPHAADHGVENRGGFLRVVPADGAGGTVPHAGKPLGKQRVAFFGEQ